MLDLTLEGLGWGMAPLSLVKPLLRDRRLAELPPGHRMSVTLYWQSARLHAAVLDRLTSAVTDAARTAMDR